MFVCLFRFSNRSWSVFLDIGFLSHDSTFFFFFCKSFRTFYVYNMSSFRQIYFFLSNLNAFSLSYFIALTRTSSRMLNRNDKTKHSCFFPMIKSSNHGEKSTWSFTFGLYWVEKILFNLHLLWVFIRNSFYFVKPFFCIYWVDYTDFLLNLLIWWITMIDCLMYNQSLSRDSTTLITALNALHRFYYSFIFIQFKVFHIFPIICFYFATVG